MSTKDRLLTFLVHSQLSQSKFEKKAGLSNGFVNNIGQGIHSASLNKIKTAFPELNTTWLVTGEGEMLISYEEFDVAAAVKKTAATTEVILSAVSELLAKANGQSATVVKEQLEGLVNKRLNP